MNSFYALYILALIVSLLAGSWRVALWAVAFESLVTGLFLMKGEGLDDWSLRIQAMDLMVVRAVLVPLFLVSFLGKTRQDRIFGMIPREFPAWAIAFILLIGGCWFGYHLFPHHSQNALHLGTAAAGILLGLFILSQQATPLGQVIGLLTVEAGIGLSEEMGASHEPWPVQLAILLAFIWMIVLCRQFLEYFLISGASGTDVADEEGEVL